MEWLHIVVITLIYVHEPKTVTWAKECEIPDYAYSEKRRKNQHEDELVCLDRDVKRDNGNSLYDSKLLSINTRKKYEGLRSDEELYCRDERNTKFLEKNNYINRVLQPPSNRSTYHKLLNRYQPYAYGNFAMDTPKNVFNIYRIKSQDYEEDHPKNMKMLDLRQNEVVENQVFNVPDRAANNWSIQQPYDGNKQNLRSSYQHDKKIKNEDLEIRKNTDQNQYQVSLQKQTEPTIVNNENLMNSKQLMSTIKPDIFEHELPNNRIDEAAKNSLAVRKLPLQLPQQTSNLGQILKEQNNNKLTNFANQKETEHIMVTGNGTVYSSNMFATKQNQNNMQKNHMPQNSNEKNNTHIDTIKNYYLNQMNEEAATLQKKLNVNQQRVPSKQNMKAHNLEKGPSKKNYTLISTQPKSFNLAKYLNKQDQNADKKIPELYNNVNKNFPQDQESIRCEGSKEQITNSVDEKNTENNQSSKKEVIGEETPTSIDETKSIDLLNHVPSTEFQSNSRDKISYTIQNSTQTANSKNKNYNWPYSLFSSHLSEFNDRPEEYHKQESDPQLAFKNIKEDSNNQISLNLINSDGLDEISKTSSDKFNIPEANNCPSPQETHETFKLQGDIMDVIMSKHRTNANLNDAGITIYNTENLNTSDYMINDTLNNSYTITENGIDVSVKGLQASGTCNSEKQTDIIKYNCKENSELNSGQHLQQFSEEKNKIRKKRCEQENLSSDSLKYIKTKINTETLQNENSEAATFKESEKNNYQQNVNKSDSEEKLKNSTETDNNLFRYHQSLNLLEPQLNEDKLKIKTDNEIISQLKTEINTTDVKNIYPEKPTSTLKKMYNRINIFKSKDGKCDIKEGSNLTGVKNIRKSNPQVIAENSDGMISDKTRVVRKSTNNTERYNNHELLQKWMELQQDFMSHIDKHNIPKFPVIKAVECEGITETTFPVQLEMRSKNLDEFPITLKESKENRWNKEIAQNIKRKNQIINFEGTNMPQEMTTVENVNPENKKRDIHCCFKLNNGHHLGEQENDREQLKQIDLKIENKKMKGCPLKETSIEMILTRDRLSREDDTARYSNLTSPRGIMYNDEMQPFQINNTNDKQQVSKIQGMREFNKINSLTKVNRNPDMWEKQIKKLYEIINEEKKGEERNKTTFSSLHKTPTQGPMKKAHMSEEIYCNAPLMTETKKKMQDEPQRSVIKMQNHNLPERGHEKKFETKVHQKANDEKLRKLVVNRIINKIETDTPSRNIKIRYHNSINKFRDDLMKDGSGEHLCSKKKGNKTKNSKIKAINQDLDKETIEGNTFKLYNKKMKCPDILENQFDTIIPNEQIKAKLLKKCENIKSNISYILNLMSELQNEGRSNPESMDSCLQFTGFDDLLNNLRKFNRNPSFSSVYGKDLNTGFHHAKESQDLNIQYSKLEKNTNGKNSRGTSDQNSSIIGPDNLSMNATQPKLKEPTGDMSQENDTGKYLEESDKNGFVTEVNATQTLESINEKNSSDMQSKTTNVQNEIPITQFIDTERIDAPDTINTDPLINYSSENSNETDINKPIVNELDIINKKKNYPSKLHFKETMNTSHLGKATTVMTNNIATRTSTEMFNEVTDERGLSFPNESILDSISGKSIIKLVQNETLGFDKYNLTSTASPSELKSDKPYEPYRLRVTNIPTNLSHFHQGKCGRNFGKLKSSGLGRGNNVSIPFDLSKLTKLANTYMQDIPQKLTMPIIIDILNSLMFNEGTNNSPQQKDTNEKRLKRENFRPYNLQIPSNNEIEINMKVKKGKKKKIRKSKYSLSKFTRGKIKNTTKDRSLKTVQKHKIESCKKGKLKPIYMPNVKGRSEVQIVPPFFFGDNIITISVTPCDNCNKNKKHKNKNNSINRNSNTNLTEVKGNDTSMVTETKYFVMSNIKGEVTEKAKTHQETQLKLPLKIFRSREKTTTVAISTELPRKFGTNYVPTSNERNNTLASNIEILLQQQKTEFESLKEPTVTEKKYLKTTNTPILKLKSERELEDLKLKLEKIKLLQKMNMDNTSNDKIFDPPPRVPTLLDLKPTEIYDLSMLSITEKTYRETTPSRKEMHEPMEFTITITLKPQKAPSTQRYTSRTAMQQGEKIKETKSQDRDTEYDSDYYTTENKLRTNKRLPQGRSQTNRMYESHALMTTTEIMATKQNSMFLPPKIQMHTPDDMNVRKQMRTTQIEIDTERNELIVRTTESTTEQTSSTHQLKDLSMNRYEFKELKNDETFDLDKVTNIAKQEMTHKYQQKTTEAPLVTESNEDYILLVTNETPQAAKNVSVTKQQEEFQYETKNQEMLPKIVTQPEFLETNMYEDSTDIQYYDELESVMQTYGERPKIATFNQLSQTTEPLNEVSPQTEPQELTRDVDYIILNSHNMTPTQPLNSEERAPISKEDWLKEELSGKQSNTLSEKQLDLVAPLVTSTSSNSFKLGNRDETNSNTDTDEDDEEVDMENDERDNTETTGKASGYNQSSSATEEEQEEDEDEEDEESTDFQELLFWQNITKKPAIPLKQPYIFPLDMQRVGNRLESPQSNTTNPSMEYEIKSMKFELEQLKNLLDSSPLVDKVSSLTNLISTPTYSISTQEIENMTDILYTLADYPVNKSEPKEFPEVVEMKQPPGENIDFTEDTSVIESTDNRINELDIPEAESYDFTNGVSESNPTYIEGLNISYLDPQSEDSSTENLAGQEEIDVIDIDVSTDAVEDSEKSSEDQGTMHLDDPSIIIEDSQADIFSESNKDNSLDNNMIDVSDNNRDDVKTLEDTNQDSLNMLSDEIMNQIELPPNNNSSELDLSDIMNTDNDTIHIESEKKFKTNNWASKIEPKEFDAIQGNLDFKETTDPNIQSEQSSEVIILDNMSNNSAEWILHSDAMWNMDPWESFKQFENNFKGSFKQSNQKDNILKDLIVSKTETDEPKLFKGIDKQMSYSIKRNHNSDTVKHNENFINKLNREQFQQRGSHNQLDHHHRKFMKPTNYYSKYHKNMGNDGAVVLFQPKLSLLGKYNEDNEKNILAHSAILRKNMFDTEEPRVNIKGIKGKEKMSLKRFYTPDRLVSKKRCSKKNKVYGKLTSNKHRNNNLKKKVRARERTIISPCPVEFSQNNAVTKDTKNSTTQSKFGADTITSRGNPVQTTTAASESNIKHSTEQSGHSTDVEVNEITTLSPLSSTTTTKKPCNTHLNKVNTNIKNIGNLENLMWNRENHWEKLRDSLNKADKLCDRSLMRKINQNFRKNIFDAKFLDRDKNTINSSRKSNQKSFNFYKQRLNRKMMLLKSLQNKDKEAKITPEEERKIKKILDGIVSRYKGHTNDTDDENVIRFKTNKLNGGSKRNMTKPKNHRKIPKGSMKFDRYKFKYRSKERHSPDNLTDKTPSQRFISVGRKKHFQILPTYNRLMKKNRYANSDFTGWGPMLKAGGSWYAETNENQPLYRDKKNYVLEMPYIRTLPNNSSDNVMSIINAYMKKIPNPSKNVNFNKGFMALEGNVDENRPDLVLYNKNKGKLPYKIDGLEQRATSTMSKKQTGTPIQGILSLLYPEDLTNSSQPINTFYRLGSQMGGGIVESPVEGIAGYSGGGVTFNNHQINSNQFEELLNTIEKDNINITDSNENKFKDLNTLFKQNLKDTIRNRSKDSDDDVKAKIKALNWLLTNKNSQTVNKLKSDMPVANNFNYFGHSQGKDKEEEIENMKKFITKYKTLLKMFEEQHNKIDTKDFSNQNLVKNFKDEILAREGNIIIKRPTATVTNVWKKIKTKDKTPMRTNDVNKNVLLDSNSKKKVHKTMYMYGQIKKGKDLENPVEDLQDNEEQEVIRHIQEDDDDNLETCNDIEFESYDDHQVDKTKDNEIAISNGTQSMANGTSMIRDGPSRIQPSPSLMVGKFKTLDKYKGYHSNQIPRLKSYKENEASFKLNTTMNKIFKSQINPLSCIGELNYDRCKANWENWTSDKNNPSIKLQQQQITDEPLSNLTVEHILDEKEMVVSHGNENNVLMLPIKFNTSDFIKLLNFKDTNESETLYQEDDLNSTNHKIKLWDPNNRNSYVFDVDKGGPNGIKNRFYITFDSLSPNTVKVKNVSTIPVSNFSDFVNMASSGLNVVSIHKFMSPWDKNNTSSYINNKNVKGNLKPEIRSIEKVCLWLRKPLSYNLTHQVPKVAISLGEVWPPMSESQGPRNMKHYLVQVDPLVTPSKFPNQHIDYPSQISKVVWKAILHGFKTPKKTWQLTNQLG